MGKNSISKKTVFIEALFLLVLSVAMLVASAPIIVVMAVAALLIASFELSRKTNHIELGLTTKRIWPAIKVQLPFTILGIAGILSFAFATGRGVNPMPANFLAYWIVSIPLQEFIFRGYFQGLLRPVMPALWNVFSVSAVFSLMHFFVNTYYAPVLVGTTFASGLAWGYAYEKERNLIGPIFSHIVLGTLLFMILGYNVV